MWRLATTAILALGLLSVAATPENGRNRKADQRQVRQAEVDHMVNNVLQWLQGVYTQNNRKARQYFSGKPERPRPFQPAGYLPPATGYPPAGSRPTPGYSEGPLPIPTVPPPQPSNPSPYPEPAKPSEPTYQPQPPNPPTYNPPSEPDTEEPYNPSSNPPYNPSSNPPYNPPTSPPYNRPSNPPYNPPTSPPYNPSSNPPYNPSTSPPYSPQTSPPYTPSNPPYNPPTSPPYNPPTSPPYNPPSNPPYNPSTSPPYNPTNPPYNPSTGNPEPAPTDTDDDKHPPHIHAITVDCGKQQMTINIEFNKPYNGLIYSQGFYNMPECVYVKENSNQIKYSFTVNLEMCGTRFFSDFENEGQAYLENVLVLQNEIGFQEVWDHIRRVRCLWEGNLTKQLVSSLSVGMLNQITSNFSGDTAMARLDIQMGRGPFAPEANGLVKIGEVMTLVISVTGDPGFDIQVKECVARDANNKNVVPLTDESGCVLKPKLFGAFQKTRETGNTGASILAYAFFNAFKFPDEMDLILQCDVELCKTDCDMCPNPGSVDPARRRKRDIVLIGNSTLGDPVTVGKGLRVIFPEDIEGPEPQRSMCVSFASLLWGGAFILLVTMTSSVTAGYFWLKMQKFSMKK